MFQSVDASGSGYIEFTEFVAACLSLESFFSNATFSHYEDVAWDLFKFFAGDAGDADANASGPAPEEQYYGG